MADAVGEPTGFLQQITRAVEFKPVLALVKQQQAFKRRKRRLELRYESLRWLGKSLERDVERDFRIFGIGERFNLEQARWKRVAARQCLQLLKSCGQRRRQHGALVDGKNVCAFREEIPKSPRHRVTKSPLRAVAVAVRLRGVYFDRSGPGYSA